MDKEIVVPKEMGDAAREAYENWKMHTENCKIYAGYEEQYNGAVAAVKAAILWLSENPIVPTDEQIYEIHKIPLMRNAVGLDRDRLMISEWQRRMFLAPEPEVPEEVKDLLWHFKGFAGFTNERESYNQYLIEAFRRGQKAGPTK